MSEILTKMLHLGLGLAAVTKEKAEALVAELVKKGQLSVDEAAEVVEELARKGEESQGQVRDSLAKLVEKAVEKLDLATRQDLSRLEERIARLEERLDSGS